MEYRTEFTYKNAIIVDETMLDEIQNEILNYCDDIEYDSKLENGDSIKFDTLDEILNYENFKEYKIQSITIMARKYKSKNKIHIKIEAQRSILTSYSYTIYVCMTTDSLNNKTLFKNNMEYIFSRHEQDKHYNKISKSSIFQWALIYYLICTSIFVYKFISDGFKVKNVLLFVITIFLSIIEIISTPLEKKQKEIFPLIVFYLGDEKNRYDDTKAGRKNFFWTVVIGGTLTVVVGIVGIIVSIM